MDNKILGNGNKLGDCNKLGEEQCGLQLVCDYPNSGYEEPIPDEQPVDYVVDTKTADLDFGE